MTRQEENKATIDLLQEKEREFELVTSIVLIDISKSLAVIADAADIIKSKINNRF